MELHGKRVALLGFGVENRALLPYLQQNGASVTICDKNLDLVLPDGTTGQLGDEYLDNLTQFDVLFRTPGIPYLTKEIQAAKQTGVVISSQTKLFMEACPATMIGVTGTKGKGTTASLIEAILKQAEAKGELSGKVWLAGNIGQPPITLLDQIQEQDWVVLELSSFQLQDLTVSPDIAVVLNVTIDHLDHHRDEAEYIAAKKNLVRYQTPGDSLVVNLDSLTSLHFADETPAQTYFFSRTKSVDQGVFVERRPGDDAIILRLPGHADQEICLVREVKLIGAYNLENITAASTAAALAGASLESIRAGVTGFTGLAHRLQFVAEVNGVTYYDDSKATTPDSTLAAVLSFESPVTLILGGSSKGADFSELIDVLMSGRVTHVITLGPEGERIGQQLIEAGAPQEVIPAESTMAEVVAQAAQVTQPGGVVLLSPAATSFHMFKNAEDRGNQFQEAVKGLVS